MCVYACVCVCVCVCVWVFITSFRYLGFRAHQHQEKMNTRKGDGDRKFLFWNQVNEEFARFLDTTGKKSVLLNQAMVDSLVF